MMLVKEKRIPIADLAKRYKMNYSTISYITNKSKKMAMHASTPFFKDEIKDLIKVEDILQEEEAKWEGDQRQN